MDIVDDSKFGGFESFLIGLTLGGGNEIEYEEDLEVGPNEKEAREVGPSEKETNEKDKKIKVNVSDATSDDGDSNEIINAIENGQVVANVKGGKDEETKEDLEDLEDFEDPFDNPPDHEEEKYGGNSTFVKEDDSKDEVLDEVSDELDSVQSDEDENKSTTSETKDSPDPTTKKLKHNSKETTEIEYDQELKKENEDEDFEDPEKEDSEKEDPEKSEIGEDFEDPEKEDSGPEEDPKEVNKKAKSAKKFGGALIHYNI